MTCSESLGVCAEFQEYSTACGEACIRTPAEIGEQTLVQQRARAVAILIAKSRCIHALGQCESSRRNEAPRQPRQPGASVGSSFVVQTQPAGFFVEARSARNE